MIRTIQIIVRGRVQGVFYRDHAKRKAQELGIFGFVRNLPDGSVEIVAQGEADQLASLVEWCDVGSPAAKVSNREIRDLKHQDFDDFSVRY